MPTTNGMHYKKNDNKCSIQTKLFGDRNMTYYINKIWVLKVKEFYAMGINVLWL